MTDSYFLAGRFGAATRLSPKALRLYAEQGLLVPAHVDPATGYRYYAATQASRARLIARLRQLGLPIARIARLIDLQPDVRLTELRAWLEVQSKRLEDQRELVEAIIRQSSGGDDPLVRAVAVRDVAPSKIVYRQHHVTVDALEAFTESAEAEIRGYLAQSGESDDGPMTLHFHEPVNHDGKGLVEVAIGYDGSLEPTGDLRIRLQPAGREAFLAVAEPFETFPAVLRVYDAIEAWFEQSDDLSCFGSPYEIYPGSGGTRFDVAYPIVR
ncbi:MULTISPECIES: MerR family transcriptional regulator [unclassified Ensifer]|uniref:MerR family transcriptional regulator n=1 Tax=unclassified Ensifer TaxID=2633371 RepID=UPI000714FBCA|nr:MULTISPECIES: MerR family transcriptional regulator [unclassified Ensifer]KQX54072.1 MerR family transcriptional regulator [Ensifer sp. Root1298]KQX85760.1 MerR family transcriptional regulator [Ensifer sp. Root1312]KRC22818.1 MerR family transcriptional regulator [Ensifer sp. Root74]KRD57411.1 MerR family transcriptional regulator [Ensifer sp. Root954]